VSIRSQLVLVALTTLVLPWAGCQYARELEGAMRSAQENALIASAGTIANALSAAPERVFRNIADAHPFNAAEGDIYVFPLRRQPLLDGYREDWNVAPELQMLPGDREHPARWMAGFTDQYLFLYVTVTDRHFEPEPNDLHPAGDRFDHIDVAFETPDGALAGVFFATNAPGLILAQRLVTGDDGALRADPEPRIQAYWLQTSSGYTLEARLPLELIGHRLWVRAIDGALAHAPDEWIATSNPVGGRLFFTSQGLDELLATFIRSGTRATVLDANGLKLGATGGLEFAADRDSADAGRGWLRHWIAADTSALPVESARPDRLVGPQISQALAGHPAAAWYRGAQDLEPLLSAAAPIEIQGQPQGVVVLEQAGDQLVAIRDRALGRLFDLTIAATAVAVAFLFGFASWISARIGRLSAAADTAIGRDGLIETQMPESRRSDEIGALARSFERLLGRLGEHTRYLRTLGGKLSHELRTPLTIVRSSLDNLESEGLRDDQRVYVTRAREGSLRLQSILSALGAAARVEESIQHAERSNFDLCELLITAVDGYRDAFPGVRIELNAPADPCFIGGAPDLVLQMLDKLMDNAVDFCAPNGTITVDLSRVAGQYRLSVSNDGAPIPEALLGRLFESLFELRESRERGESGEDKPHFGLGLYIVRLIAQFHGGAASAANLPEGRGAVFTVALPII